PAADLRRFAALAADRRMAAVALDGLHLAENWFGTSLPAILIDLLERSASMQNEASAAYLRPLRPLDVLWSDLGALGGWRERSQLVCEHVLPPASYMLRAYGASSRALLPALYAHRI